MNKDLIVHNHPEPIGSMVAGPQLPALIFHSDIEEVGRLWVDESGKFHFEGDMDTAAREFLKLFGELWQSYLKNK